MHNGLNNIARGSLRLKVYDGPRSERIPIKVIVSTPVSSKHFPSAIIRFRILLDSCTSREVVIKVKKVDDGPWTECTARS